MNTMPSSILQSALWAEFQHGLGKKVHEESGDGWTFLAVLESTVLGRYLYCPHGPVAQDVAGFQQAVAALSRRAKAEGAHFVRLEPGHGGVETSHRMLTAAGLRKAPTDIQPQRTWMLDLTQDEKSLLAGMRPTSRNLHRNIHKKGVTIDTSSDPDDISILLGFLHEVSDRAGFRPQSDTYLELAAKTLMPSGAAKLFIARLDGQPIAAALSYETGTTRAYAHAAANDEHRRLNAAIPLLVTMILDAKKSGLTHFDMWGVSPRMNLSTPGQVSPGSNARSADSRWLTRAAGTCRYATACIGRTCWRGWPGEPCALPRQRPAPPGRAPGAMPGGRSFPTCGPGARRPPRGWCPTSSASRSTGSGPCPCCSGRREPGRRR